MKRYGCTAINDDSQTDEMDGQHTIITLQTAKNQKTRRTCWHLLLENKTLPIKKAKPEQTANDGQQALIEQTMETGSRRRAEINLQDGHPIPAESIKARSVIAAVQILD